MRSSTPAGPPPITVHYTRQVGWSGGIFAEFVAAAPSSVYVTFNYDERAMIGLWSATLEDKLYRRLVSGMRRTRYTRHVARDNFAPDSKFITVGVRTSAEQKAPTVRVFDQRHLPRSIDALAREFEQAIDELRREPVRVLAGHAELTPDSIAPGAPLSVTLTLRNAGKLPAALANPLAAAPGDDTGIQLYLRSMQDPDTEQGVAIDVQQLYAAVGAPTDARVTLAPTEQLTIEVRKQVYLAPGTYTGALSFINLAHKRADPQVVEGSLWLELGTLNVTRPARVRQRSHGHTP
jgi:hypothetical protein